MKHLNGLNIPYVEVDGNKLIVTLQDGTVSENGYNGIQVSEMILVLKEIFSALNKELPCRENDDTLYYLARAYTCQLERNADRTERGVEGKLAL